MHPSVSVAVLSLLVSEIHGRYEFPVTFQAWGFNPNKTDPKQFPEYPLPGSTDSVGLALSGGGTRAMMCSAGILQGLRRLGVLDNVRYISSVSGGTWAASLFTYLPDKIDVAGGFGCKKKSDQFSFCDDDSVDYQPVSDDALLGLYRAPQTITPDQLKTLKPGSISYPAKDLGLHLMVFGLVEYLFSFNAPPASGFWNFLVDRYVLVAGALGTHHQASTLAPIHHLGTNNFRPWTLDAASENLIQSKGDNDLLSEIELDSEYKTEKRFDKVRVKKSGSTTSIRPYLIMNSALVASGGVPVSKQCKVSGGVLAPFECTAHYCGVPATYGGGWTSNFASRLKMNFADSKAGEDSSTCPLCDADQDWVGRLFDDNDPKLDSGGKYKNVYTRLSATPTNGGWHHQVVETDRVISQFSLKDIVGPSSAAPSQALCVAYSKLPSWADFLPEMTPSYHYTPANKLLNKNLKASQIVSQRHVFVDGGSLENTGITALLRRRLASIISLVSSGSRMTAPSLSNDKHPTIDNQVSDLWGYAYDKTNKKWVVKATRTHVFDAGTGGKYFFALIDGLWAASLTGGAVFLQTNIVVKPNAVLGLGGPDLTAKTYKVRITWIYNQKNPQWWGLLSSAVQKTITDTDKAWYSWWQSGLTSGVNKAVAKCKSMGKTCPDDVENFLTEFQAASDSIVAQAKSGILSSDLPYYSTFFELGLQPVQSQALSNMHAYNVMSNPSLIQYHFPSKRSIMVSRTRGVCVSRCPTGCTSAIKCSCAQDCALPPSGRAHERQMSTLAVIGYCPVIRHTCTTTACCQEAHMKAVCAGIKLQTCLCNLGIATVACPTKCVKSAAMYGDDLDGLTDSDLTVGQEDGDNSSRQLLWLLTLLGLIPLCLCLAVVGVVVMKKRRSATATAVPLPKLQPVVPVVEMQYVYAIPEGSDDAVLPPPSILS